MAEGDQPKVTGDILYAREYNAVFKHLDSDQTGGSITGATNETEIGEVTIPANKVTNGVLVTATGSCAGGGSGGGNVLAKLRAGTSTTGSGNALYKTATRIFLTDINTTQGWAIVYYIDDLTWSSTNYVNIMGKCSKVLVETCTCDSIEVIFL